MSKTRYYQPCSLTKGNTQTRTHLPEVYAKLGTFVSLKNDDGSWDGPWKITSVGEPIKAEYAEAKAHAYGDIWKPSTALTERGRK